MTTHDTGFSADQFLAALDRALAAHDRRLRDSERDEPLKVCDYCFRSEIDGPSHALTITQGSDGLWMCELCDKMLMTLAGNGDPMPPHHGAQIWPGAGLPSAPIPNPVPQPAKLAGQLSREEARELADKVQAIVEAWSDEECAVAHLLITEGRKIDRERARDLRRKAGL